MPICRGDSVSSSDAEMIRKSRIVVYAGPTGGHLFPAQFFSENFRRKFPDCQIDLVTSLRGKTLVDSMPAGIFRSVHYLPEFGFSSGFSWRTFRPFVLMPFLFLRSFLHLRKFRPHLCVGFGSFVSYPGMMMARWMNLPTLIHEQNMIPGKATLWLANHMDAVAESFEGTKFPKKPKKLFSVGLPLRSFILSSVKNIQRLNLPRPFTILVLGGSQGSHSLNAIVLDIFAQLSVEERAKIAVIHIAGKQDQEWVFQRYQQLALSNEIYSFHKAMDELFLKSDLVICRAGANTLFELAIFGLPALVVPYPHAGGHQIDNAASFSVSGGLLYHEEDLGLKAWLLDHLKRIIENPHLLDERAGSMKKMAKPFATEKLVEIAESLIRGK